MKDACCCWPCVANETSSACLTVTFSVCLRSGFRNHFSVTPVTTELRLQTPKSDMLILILILVSVLVLGFQFMDFEFWLL